MSCIRVIDQLTKAKLFEIADNLNLNLPKTITKPDLKNIIISELNKNKVSRDKYIFPKVANLVAIGDLHGDLVATIKALKLAGAISQSIPNTTRDINKINWIGGKLVVVQLGDQIDRVRPSNLVNDLCPDNDPEINSDEGSDLKIICLFEKLNKEAKKVGGAVFSILGNHELMNVDGDFRYVSPKEFKEFGTFFKEKRTDDNSKPYGYYSRKKAFEPGGIVSKKLANTRYSVLQVGSWLFVHGGISYQIASNFLLDDINYYIKKWLNGNKDKKTLSYVNSVYHNDDEDMSPFWTRVFSDLDEWTEEKHCTLFNKTIEKLNINNKRNRNNMIKGMVVGHSPQFMYNESLNGACNNRLWRVDVGMSRAFGKTNEDINRKVQILKIENDKNFSILRES